MTKYEIMKFLETSRDGGVVSNIVVDAIIDHIGSYIGDVDWDGDAIIDHIGCHNGDVDWNRVEERLEAYTSGWLFYAQDAIQFYAKNYKEVNGIVSQDDAFSVIEAISTVCYRAYNIVLSDIVKKLKAL